MTTTTDTPAATTAEGKRFLLELETAHDRYEKAKADFIEGIGEGSVSYAVRWKASDLIRLEKLVGIAGNFMPRDESPEGYGVDQAAAAFMANAERGMQHLCRGESGSTGGYTRLDEAIEAQATLTLYAALCDARHYGKEA